MAKKSKTHSSTCEACAHQIGFYYDLDQIKNVTREEIAAMNEVAQERAEEMVKEGYVSGELNCLITRSKNREYEVRGWWSIHREPITFNAILNFEGMEPQYYQVASKDDHSPNEVQFRKDCEVIASKYWRSKKRNEMSMLEYFEVEIDKAGWNVTGKNVERIDMN